MHPRQIEDAFVWAVTCWDVDPDELEAKLLLRYSAKYAPLGAKIKWPAGWIKNRGWEESEDMWQIHDGDQSEGRSAFMRAIEDEKRAQENVA